MERKREKSVGWRQKERIDREKNKRRVSSLFFLSGF
jgi:hypothetical protein